MIEKPVSRASLALSMLEIELYQISLPYDRGRSGTKLRTKKNILLFLLGSKDVREEFLTFIKLERITGEKIAENILAFLKENNVPVTNMRGQGYDGASKMSSSTSGVQGRIKKEAPLATYVHCDGHCLNFVISKSCALPQVRNVIECLKNCCRFFLKSFKRSGLLELIVKHNIVNAGVVQDKMGRTAHCLSTFLPSFCFHRRGSRDD